MNKLIKKFLLLFIMVFSIMGMIGKVEAFASSVDPKMISEIRIQSGLGITDESVLAPETDGSWYLYFDKATAKNQFLPYKVYDSNVAVFCTMFGSVSPAYNNYLIASNNKLSASSCVLDNSWDEAIKAGVAAIIDETTQDNKVKLFYGSNGLKKYYDAEIAINKFLNSKKANSCHLSNTGCTGSGIDAGTDVWKISSTSNTEVAGLLAIADDAYEYTQKIKNGININVASYNSSFALVNDSTYGEVYVLDKIFGEVLETNYSLTNATSYKLIIKNSNGKEVYSDYGRFTTSENGSVKAIICNNNTSTSCKRIENFEKIAPGNYTIDVQATYSTGYDYAENYKCTGDSTVKYQSITLAETDYKSISNIGKATFRLTVENEETPELKLTINKKSTTGQALKGAVIRVTGVDVDFDETYYMSSSPYVINDIKEYGTYKIEETVAPTGYVLTSSVQKVTFSASNTSRTVTFVNEPEEEKEEIPELKLTVNKKSTTGQVLKGAVIRVTGVDVDFDETYYMSSSPYVINDIKEYGTYKIEETVAPTGYVLTSSVQKVTFSASNTSRTVTFVNEPEAEPNEVPSLLIRKQDESGKGISGATIKVTGIDVDFNKTYVMDSNIIKIKDLPGFGKYKIQETKAPAGYVLNDKIETVTLSKNEPDAIVTITNVAKVEESANLVVKKVDDKGNALAGATLKLLDSKGNKIKEWNSEATAKSFYNLPLGTYIIEEVKAPNGYELSSEKKTIQLTESGKTYTAEIKNVPVVKVPDTLSNISKFLIVIGIMGLAIGCWLLYYNKRKNA